MDINNLKAELKEDFDRLLPKNLIHLGFRGSIAYGTYVPSDQPNSIDDKDIMGVYLNPIEHYLGFGLSEHKEKFIGHWDAVSYELRKMFGLLLKQNPNVLGQLWLPEDRVIMSSVWWEKIIDNRHLFASKLAYKSFAGYASGQLHRMTHMAFEGYMGPKRRKLVRKFGYDVKNASHLIRLLRQSIEFLNTGTMLVDRTDIDAEELISIKSGKWKLEKVKKEAERLFQQAKNARDKSFLPEKPDYQKIQDLLIHLLRGII